MPFIHFRPHGKALHQPFGIVDHQLEPVRGPAELHVEHLLVGPPAGLQDRDHPGAGQSLGGVHRDAVGMVDMTELGVVPGNRIGSSPVTPELYKTGSDLHDGCLVAVGDVRHRRPAEARRGRPAVAGPADPVPRPDLDLGGVVHAQVARGVARGPERPHPPIRMVQFNSGFTFSGFCMYAPVRPTVRSRFSPHS